MSIQLIGEHPLLKDSDGKLVSRIGTLFTTERVLLTLRGMTHAMQRFHYQKLINGQRLKQGLEPLDELDGMESWSTAVDLIMEDNCILIRPNPERMDLAFAADEMLQELPYISKAQIRFLHARNTLVQQAIRSRGEYWRISPRPQSENEVITAIGASKIAIGLAPIYYYSPSTGTRFLTYDTVCSLGKKEVDLLRRYLQEIKTYMAKRNRLFNREIAFFGLKQPFDDTLFDNYDFDRASDAQLRHDYHTLLQRLRELTEPSLLVDDVKNTVWRNKLFACLTDERNDAQTEYLISGLTEEFFRQVQWLPGGRIANGELIFDSIFEERKRKPFDAELGRLCDLRVCGFIFNYIREYSKLEYINIGRLLPGLRTHPDRGAHCSYLVEYKNRESSTPDLKILRMQRWGIQEHLSEHHDLLRAIMETQDYTEYTLDRRLGCWELGVPVPSRQVVRTIPDEYCWPDNAGVSRIWLTYFERDFIHGIATDKIHKTQPEKLKDPEFAKRLAKLLGTAAAPNIVVGRASQSKRAIFDNGDELITLDAQGYPSQIVTADHAGTFVDYEQPLIAHAADYALPVLTRKIWLANPAEFALVYLHAMQVKLTFMQEEYRRIPAAFNALFQHSKQGEKTFAHRWKKVLERLDATDIPTLMAAIRTAICAEIKLDV